jgi:hypothetical protein
MLAPTHRTRAPHPRTRARTRQNHTSITHAEKHTDKHARKHANKKNFTFHDELHVEKWDNFRTKQ